MHKKVRELVQAACEVPDDTLETLDTIIDLCSHDIEVIKQREILESLHLKFWQSIFKIIPNLITKETKDLFTIPEGYHKWLDFGCVSDKLCNDPDFLLALDEPLPPELHDVRDEYKIVYLHTWLEEAHARNIQIKYKEEITKRLHEEEKKLEEYPYRLSSCIERRSNFLEWYPKAQQAIIISEEIENRLPVYAVLMNKINRSELISSDERTDYVRLTSELQKLRDMRVRKQQSLHDILPCHELIQIDDEIEELIFLKSTLEKNVQKAQTVVDEDEMWRKEMRIGRCREQMCEEIRRIRSFSELAALRSRTKPVSIFMGRDPVPTPAAIIKVIEDILEIDPQLYSAQARKKHGFPSILVVPIVGNGVYDFDRNTLIIPSRPQGGLIQAVATALIEYRLDADEDSILRNSYLKLRKNEGIFSSIQLRDRMLRDYLDWVLKEAKGYRVLDTNTAQWFLENIAPPLFALKCPRRINNFSITQWQIFIARHEKQIGKENIPFDTYFRLGVAYWQIEQYEKSYICFAQAAEQNPEHLDACYNAALSSYKIQQKADASTFWRKYLLLDKRSFWTNRVQEFLRKL